jgi:hypothetical protein
MKKLIFALLLIFSLPALGQYSDTSGINNFIRTTIRDKRPEKVTAEQLQAGMIGITNTLSKYNPFNISLSNNSGLSVVHNNRGFNYTVDSLGFLRYNFPYSGGSAFFKGAAAGFIIGHVAASVNYDDFVFDVTGGLTFGKTALKGGRTASKLLTTESDGALSLYRPKVTDVEGLIDSLALAAFPTTLQQATAAGHTTSDSIVLTNGPLRQFLYNSGSQAKFGTSGSHPVSFVTNGAERMILESAGNLLIGSGSANRKLDVRGTAYISESLNIGQLVGVQYPLAIQRGTTSALPLAYLNQNHTADGSVGLSIANSNADNTSYPLMINNQSSPGMVFTGAGRLGLGTTSPTSTAHVNGSFAAKVDPIYKTADFTAGDHMTYVVNNGAGSPIAVTLPSASSCPDRIYWFKITTGAAGGAVTIGGFNAVLGAGTNGPWCTIVSNGVTWILLQGF